MKFNTIINTVLLTCKFLIFVFLTQKSNIDILSFDTEIVCNLNSVNIGGRAYDDIVLNGRLQPNYFKGEAWISDDDLELDFSGEVDFSKDKPVMDFVANVVEADLVKLNLYNKESVAKLSSLIEINLKGNDWSNIEGELGVYYTSLETSNNHHYFNDVLFTSEEISLQTSRSPP